jgi:hypothetical protein
MRLNGLPFLALLSLLGLSALLTPAQAWYPMNPVAEDATATWCTSCPLAYQGIAANKQAYDRNEFNVVRYYSSTSGGQFGCATSTARISYYGVVGFPEVHFDGPVAAHYTTAETASGDGYKALIESMLDDPTYFRINIVSYSFTAPTGSIDIDLEVKEDVPSIATMKLRMMITESGIVSGEETLEDVTRASIADVPLTVNLNGQTQHVTQSFPIDAGWNPSNLAIVAFVQDDADKRILAGASTHEPYPCSFRTYALGDKFEVGEPTESYYFEYYRTFNTGAEPIPITWTTTMDGPEGWETTICSSSMCYGPTYTQTLAPGASANLKIEVIAPTSGVGVITLNISSPEFPDPNGRTILYTYVTDDIDMLVVDDDGLQDYESYYTAALDYYGIEYAVLNTVYTQPTADLLNNFDTVIWAMGLALPTVDTADRTALTGYLNAGGHLFISGQELGYELQHVNASAWQQNTLHTFFYDRVTDDFTLEPVDGDPISDGIPLTIEGGDGADNQGDQEEIYPADGSTTAIWGYNGSQVAANRADTGVYKLVYFGFGYEAIDNARDRALVMHRILNWLNGVAGVDEPLFRPVLAVYPNPIQGSASLRFTLPADEHATLALYGADGRLVRTLASGQLDAGPHVIDWDRTGGAGDRLPAGLYYCRLEGEQTRLAQKLVLLK